MDTQKIIDMLHSSDAEMCQLGITCALEIKDIQDIVSMKHKAVKQHKFGAAMILRNIEKGIIYKYEQ